MKGGLGLAKLGKLGFHLKKHTTRFCTQIEQEVKKFVHIDIAKPLKKVREN